MKEVVFKDGKVQKGHRVKIPKAIIDTLDIKEGDKVTIKFDVGSKKLVLEVDDA
jgi:bifunctional DNA-binding transcriptional regulator/antitoxin component of YhaV-PrlF toxin-antitoxin module